MILEEESVPNQEQTDLKYPGIKFEPGLHPLQPKEGKIWNDAVARRLSQYHPKVLTIDSLQPSFGSEILYKPWIVDYFPGNPAEINPDDKSIYVVAGDVIDLYRPLVHLKTRPVSSVDCDVPNDANTFVEDMMINLRLKSVEEAGAILTVSSLLLAASRLAATKMKSADNKQYKDVKTVPRITRRQFIKMAGSLTFVLGLGLVMGRKAVEYASAKVTDEATKESILQIAKIIRPFFSHDLVLQGRMALLAAKTEDSLDYLQMPKDVHASIVMGASHGYETDLLTNIPKRRKAISAFAQAVTGYANDVFRRCGINNPEYLKESINALLDLIGLTEIIKVDNAGVRLGIPSLSISQGDISSLTKFQSKNVETAIQNLRPV